MMRYVFPVLLGIAGCAFLAGLGVWQLQRLAWKEGVIAEIEARISDAPAPLPAAPDRERDAYRAVSVTGIVAGPGVAIFDTWRGFGAGVRVVIPVDADGRRIMADLGAVPWEPGTAPAEAAQRAPEAGAGISIEGNLAWPEAAAADGPVRDVGWLARELGAEDVLVVARQVAPETPFTPIPVGTSGIPNDHLGYAIQWFGLALVWAGMTVFLLRRMARRQT